MDNEFILLTLTVNYTSFPYQDSKMHFVPVARPTNTNMYSYVTKESLRYHIQFYTRVGIFNNGGTKVSQFRI